MKKILGYTAIVAGLTSLLCLYCTKNIAGGTEVGNPSVVAMLYEPDGTTPAIGAKVKFYPVDNNPFPALHKSLAAIDSTITDSLGRYSIASVTAGTYNIIGSKDGNKSLLDSIKISSTTDSIPSDTLQATGSLTGVVRLRPEHSSTNVYILIFGTNTFTSPKDSVGNFTLDSMAGGTYRVKILTTIPNYVPLDTNFTIRAGKLDMLADTIRLRYTGIPVPTGLKLSYDTMKQIVTVTWSKADTAFVKSYNVYRCNIDSNTVAMRINASPVADTIYRDSTAIQDQTYEYNVVALDKGDNAGKMSAGDSVRIESAFTLQTTIGNGSGTGDGFFNALSAVSVDKFGNIFAGDVLNYRIQKFDSLGNFVKAWGSNGSGDSQFGREIRDMAIDTAGNVYVVDQGNSCIKKFDNDGNFLLKWGSDGTANGQFKTPYRISVTNQYVYIGDWNGIRVQKFTLDGGYISNIVLQNSVQALAATDSLIFIADQSKKQILKYSTGGLLLDSITTITEQINGLFAYNQFAYAVLAYPKAIVGVDYLGHIAFRSIIAGANNYDAPTDIHVTSSGQIFIGINNGYIQKYRLKQNP